MGERKLTTDHDVIRLWMEERGARPSAVKNSLPGDDAGVLYVDFPDGVAQDVDELTWDTFFKTFERQFLAFVYQETASDGRLSRECALIARDTGESAQV